MNHPPQTTFTMHPLLSELHDIFLAYWPHIVLVISVVASAAAAVHAAMTKRDVRAAIGWVGVVIFSPFFGPLVYLVAGINRMRKTRVTRLLANTIYAEEVIERVLVDDISHCAAPQFTALKKLGDQVSRFRLVGCNDVRMLSGGDETYPAMLAAIRGARHSVALQSYIFDNDEAGRDIAQALIDAHERGVKVRVLIDAVGSKYSRPPITEFLRSGGCDVALFNRPVLGLRLVYANLRSHRKVLIVDGLRGFTGGMNIREGFVTAIAGKSVTHDTHFQVAGPIMHQLMVNFAQDWEFTTGERLKGTAWYPTELPPFTEPGVPLRCVPSGPDSSIGSTHSMLLGALAVAQSHVRIQSPYFLPDLQLISALVTAARRGVRVDIVIPGANNLKLVNAAMMAQLDDLVFSGCHVWRASGTFDHSKLFTVDSNWSYVGSSNLDPRSLRLNFELDLEVFDRDLTVQLEARIDKAIGRASQITALALARAPFLERLRNRVVWLASPYL